MPVVLDKVVHIYTGTNKIEYIPTMREVLELLEPSLKAWVKKRSSASGGIRLNIELKNSVYDYPLLEDKIVEMVHEFGVQDAVVYSTFYTDSLLKVHKLDPKAELGVLDTKVSDCLYKALGLEKAIEHSDSSFSFALHPCGFSTDIPAERLEGRTVRGWFGGHLFPEKSTGKKMDLSLLEKAGLTDVFLNEPEVY